MLALRIFFNSHAGGWSLYRPYTIKSILLKTVSLNRLQFFFILDFIFTTIITSKVWKIILCLEENLFSEANFEYFRNFTRFKKIYVIQYKILSIFFKYDFEQEKINFWDPEKLKTCLFFNKMSVHWTSIKNDPKQILSNLILGRFRSENP